MMGFKKICRSFPIARSFFTNTKDVIHKKQPKEPFSKLKWVVLFLSPFGLGYLIKKCFPSLYDKLLFKVMKIYQIKVKGDKISSQLLDSKNSFGKSTSQKNIVKFIQVIDSRKVPFENISTHPHYSLYARSLLRKGIYVRLVLLDLKEIKDVFDLQMIAKDFGIDYKKLEIDKVNYVLMNQHGDTLFDSDKFKINPISLGLPFLESPTIVDKIAKVEEELSKGGKFEHVYFMFANFNKEGNNILSQITGIDGEREPISETEDVDNLSIRMKKNAKMFRRAHLELSYGFDHSCSFLEVVDPDVAKSLGIYANTSGIYAFFPVNNYNRIAMSARPQIVLGLNELASLECPKDLANYEQIRKFIFHTLFYYKKVQYCPHSEQIRNSLHYYKENKDKVLFIAINPLKLTQAEFIDIYNTLIKLEDIYKGVRIVLTDYPTHTPTSLILPDEIFEKFTIRYIDYGRGYKLSDLKVKPIEECKKSSEELHFIEKHKLSIGEGPLRLEDLTNFLQNLGPSSLYRENEKINQDPDSSIIRLNSSNFQKRFFEEDLHKSRILLGYCNNCVRCKQVNSIFSKASSAYSQLYTYNISNESSLNLHFPKAPLLLYFSKGSTIPTMAINFDKIIIGTQDEQDIEKLLRSFTNAIEI